MAGGLRGVLFCGAAGGAARFIGLPNGRKVGNFVKMVKLHTRKLKNCARF